MPADQPISVMTDDYHTCIYQCCHCESCNKVETNREYETIICWHCGKESLAGEQDHIWIEACQGDLSEKTDNPFDGLTSEDGKKP